MAARKRKTVLGDDWKAKIQTTQLVNRLNKCALGEVELTGQQIKSIEILLRKTIPDLKSIDNTVSGPNGGPVQTSLSVSFIGTDTVS